MIGTPCGAATRCASYTRWRASGLIAGPERPARTAPITGRPVSTSIAIPTKVLTTARPSVPASMHRRAFSATSVWFGESLVKSGLDVARRQTSTTRADMAGSFPKTSPPSSTFGQETLISMASTGESSKRRASSSYSPSAAPATLAKKRVSPKSSPGRIRSMTSRLPGFWRPMEFSIPHGVSYTRCGGLPSRGSRVVPLRQTAPASRLLKPATRVYSSPKPTHPERRTTGEARVRPQSSTARLGGASGSSRATAAAALDMGNPAAGRTPGPRSTTDGGRL